MFAPASADSRCEGVCHVRQLAALAAAAFACCQIYSWFSSIPPIVAVGECVTGGAVGGSGRRGVGSPKKMFILSPIPPIGDVLECVTRGQSANLAPGDSLATRFVHPPDDPADRRCGEVCHERQSAALAAARNFCFFDGPGDETGTRTGSNTLRPRPFGGEGGGTPALSSAGERRVRGSRHWRLQIADCRLKNRRQGRKLQA
jgi:hypothetical protein